MKHIKYLTLALFFLSILSCKTTEETILDTKRVISHKDFKEEFSITYDEPRSLKEVDYYWYKARSIQHSFKDYSGELLDGIYTKYFKSNGIAEKGNFEKGLKTGEWKIWYKNSGLLKLSNQWRNGELHGREMIYDSLGKLNQSGNYKNGLKEGFWVLHKSKDTLYYKEGDKISKKVFLADKESMLSKLFKKQKEKDANKKKKSNFLEKLFSKKEKTNTSKKI